MTAIGPANVADFQSWLAKGLGRAALHLQQNDSAPYLDVLLDACIHYVHYDIQCEDSRVPYLWTLIGVSRKPEFFRDALLETLLNKRGEPDEVAWSQVFGLARHFVERGDVQMREAMYRTFEDLRFEKAGRAPAEELVLLDGIDGFLFAANVFDIASSETEIWEFCVVVRALEEKIGSVNVRAEMAKTAAGNEQLAKLFEAADREWNRSSSHEQPRDVIGYEPLMKRPFDKDWGSDLRRWAEKASTEELKALAADMAGTTDYNKLVSMLHIFDKYEFQGDIEVLLAFINDGRRIIKGRSLRALRKVCHPSVRLKGLELLRSTNRPSEGLELLVSNYETGDFALIWDVLQRQTNSDIIHAMGFSLDAMNDKFSDQEAERLMLWLYETGPCSMCRTNYVRGLASMQRLPDWTREECLYDAEEATVAVAQEALASVNTH
jgi:hypothetical protein